MKIPPGLMLCTFDHLPLELSSVLTPIGLQQKSNPEPLNPEPLNGHPASPFFVKSIA